MERGITPMKPVEMVSDSAPAPGGAASAPPGCRRCRAWSPGLALLPLLSFLLFLPAHAAQPDLAQGKKKYMQLCAPCHGASGRGDGPAAAALNPKPRDYTDKKFSISDDAMRDIIKRGGAAMGKSPVMPAWGQALSDEDIRNLIAYIRSLGASAK